jgi:type I restriction enzyme S subunit
MVSAVGTLGACHVVQTKDRFYYKDASVLRFRPKEAVHSKFIQYAFGTNQILDQVNGGSGSTVGTFTIERANKTRMTLPPLAEQRRIAEILDKADALRAKRRAALAQLDTLTGSIYLDMFGDPATNPKGLPTTQLRSICTRITDGTHQPPTWSPSGIPFLFVSNVVTGEITFDTQKYISDETHAELTRRCAIDIGDVLYSTVGSYGVPAVVRTARKFAFQRHIAHLKPDRNVLEPEFLKAMLASPPLKRQANQAARGVAQKTVNLADIREFLVFCPSLELQRDFSRRGAAIQQLGANHRAALADNDCLFASLQHRAFRGQL